MIKTIIVKNFQSHSNTKLELSDGLNTFIGKSDSGKSAIIRALRALLYKSSFYLKMGESSGEVGIGFSDCDISRKMDAGKVRKCPSCKADVSDNAGSYICQCGQFIEPSTKNDFYIVDKTEKYEKFGVNIPDFILDKTKIRSVSFVDFDEDLNISNQHDDMFFIAKSYSGLKRNKILSSLIPDSEKIDVLIKNMISENSKNKQLYEVIQVENEEIEKKVSEAEGIVSELKKIQEEIRQEQTRLDNIKKEISELSILRAAYTRIMTTYPVALKIPSVKTYIEAISTDSSKIEGLMASINSIETIKKFKDSNKQKLLIVDVKKVEFGDVDRYYEVDTNNKTLSGIAYQYEKYIAEDVELTKNKEKIMLDIKTTNKQMEYFIEKEAICPIIKDKYCDRCKTILKA